MKSDVSDHPDVVKFGDVSLTVIERGGKTGVRLRDPNARNTPRIHRLQMVPRRPRLAINAKWVAYPQPKTIAITNILGMTDQEPSPGYAEFTLKGKTMRLEPVIEDGELFFMFKDATSAKTTYGAGRFLVRRHAKGRRSRARFQQSAQSSLRVHRVRHLSAAAETEHTGRGHRSR